MESGLDFYAAKALLEWQVELGADEALLDAPIDRYALAAAKPKPTNKQPPQAPQKEPKVDAVGDARKLASAAQDLAGLRAAMDHFPHCELQKGAKQLVFADGNPTAKLMIIGEAPGRDEDRAGHPFAGPAGQLLDKMLEAIGLDRASSDPKLGVYITNVLPWRLLQNRAPRADEIAMMKPFLERHVALVNPDVLVLMGDLSCHAALEKRGIKRLRGQWVEAFGKPALPMFNPEFLLRTPIAKREAWADLLDLKAKLQG